MPQNSGEVANIFSHSMGCSSFSWWHPLKHQGCFNVWWISMYFFLLSHVLLISYLKKPLLDPWSQTFAPMFSSKTFIVLAINFRFMIHLESIVYMMWGRGPISFFCMWRSSCPSTMIKFLKTSVDTTGKPSRNEWNRFIIHTLKWGNSKWIWDSNIRKMKPYKRNPNPNSAKMAEFL